LPASVLIRDVSLRDGLQDEAPISTEAKIAIAEALVAAGVRELELTSFVRPDRVPAMADAEALSAATKHLDVVRWGLVLNRRGAERMGSDAETGIRVVGKVTAGVLHQAGEAVDIVDEPALPWGRRKSAETGMEALQLIEEVRPQIAILDVGLPEIDGFEVARRIRANPKLSGIWLIALTGYGQESDRQTGEEVGFDEHLVKPVDTDELLKLLDKMRSVNGRKPKRVGEPLSSTA